MNSQEAEQEHELDELLADLTDRSASFEPIRPEAREARRERLAAGLRDAGLDALLIEPGATLGYLSPSCWSLSERPFALVAFADGSWLWVCPAFEETRARAELARVEARPDPMLTWQEHEHAFEPLAAALRERRVERIALEPQIRHFVAWGLAETFGRDRVLSGAALVRKLRGCKEEHEIALLRAAGELTQEAVAAVAERLRPGFSDHALGILVRRAQERLGLRDVWVLPLIDAGAAFPHGAPEGRVLEPSSRILVDTGGALHGYQSDMTRTWVLDGKPSAEFERAWFAVRDAELAAFDSVRPGVPCCEVDRAARERITAAGFGEGYELFTHRLGHGIGLEGHEEPYLDGGNTLPLEPGMTFSDEPGIYVPSEYGVRIEDILVVTEDGADHFGTWQPSPTQPIARA